MPTPRRRPGRIAPGTPTGISGTPTDCTSTLTEFSRAPTDITVTGIARIATRATRFADIATGTTPRVTAGRLRGRASSPTGTVTGTAPGTFIPSIAPAPTTGTERDPSLPAAC